MKICQGQLYATATYCRHLGTYVYLYIKLSSSNLPIQGHLGIGTGQIESYPRFLECAYDTLHYNAYVHKGRPAGSQEKK